MLGRIYVTKINVTKHIATLENENVRLKKRIESLEKTIVSEDRVEYIIEGRLKWLMEMVCGKIDEVKEDCKFSDERLEKSIPGIVRSEIAKSDIQDQVLLKVVKAGLRVNDQE